MKLEHLEETNPDYPNDSIVRLFDFNSAESLLFYQVIERLISTREDINLDSLSFIKSINCNLTLSISEKDRGITQIKDSNFECKLTIKSYSDMLNLIQAFNNSSVPGHYQSLYDLLCDIDFLYSVNGCW